ncbi:MAG TPA: RIP metalloprotease RseP [Xanthobacteraceae bacterium]|nr:RIP metalloprotease RseP [Xanthobacteraceae bacterium]
MAFFGSVGALGGLSTFYYLVVPFLFVLTVVVFFHELGHFLVARWCGVRVMVFSIGFGRELVGFTDRHATRWKIAAVPLGGYVKFFGDENVASVPDRASVDAMSAAERRESFFHQPLDKRAAIVAAGPIANFLLAIAIFAAVFALYGRPDNVPRVDGVEANSAAAAAGFKPGDVVVAIDGQPIKTFTDMQRLVRAHPDEKIQIAIERDGQTLTLDAVPTLKEVPDSFGKIHRFGQLGIQGPKDRLKVGPFEAVGYGAEETWSIIEETFSYLYRMVTGHESADQLGGPVGIALMSGEAARLGFDVLIRWVAAISVSIGLLNLFPIPLLDGGHLLFYGLEAVRGRPLSERTQEIGFRIGFAIVLMLLVFATYNDIPRLFAVFHRIWS